MKTYLLTTIVTASVLIGCNKESQNYIENGVVKTIVHKKKTGEIAIPAQFDFAEDFSTNSNYAAIHVGKDFTNQRVGIIDKNGKIVINPQYKSASINNDYIRFETENKKAGLYIKDQLKIPPQFDRLLSPSEDLIGAYVGESAGFINTEGKFVINLKFQGVSPFSEGLASVVIDGKFGSIDKNGNFVISPQFDRLWYFRDSLAIAGVGGKVGVIDKSGKFVINPQYESMKTWPIIEQSIPDANYKLIPFKSDGKWGYLETNGTIKITPQFDDATFFYENIALVKIGDKFGYINIDGKILINPIFDEAKRFYKGKAVVKIDGKYRIIDNKGNFATDTKFSILGGDTGSDLIRFVNLENGNLKYGYVYR